MARVCSLLWLASQQIVYNLHCGQCGYVLRIWASQWKSFCCYCCGISTTLYANTLPRSTRVYSHLPAVFVHSTFRNVCQNAERLVQLAVEEENIFRMVQRGLRVSTCSLPTSPFREWVWEILHEDFFCQNHVQQVQHLEVVAVGHRLEFCRWMSAHRRLAHCILTRNEHNISEMAWTTRWNSILGIVEICAEDSKATSSKVLLYICGLLSMEICWPDRTYSRLADTWNLHYLFRKWTASTPP